MHPPRRQRDPLANRRVTTVGSTEYTTAPALVVTAHSP